MDLLLWITAGFIIIGFLVLFSMKKNMERKVAFLKSNMENIETMNSSAKSVIWWIVGCSAWGIISMILSVWWFSTI